MLYNRFELILRIFVGVSGAFSVLFGAWLSHAGQTLSPDIHARLATALQYQFLHTIVLLVLWLYYRTTKHQRVVYISGLFIAGIILFSGSLYLKSLLQLDVIGKAAPLGGTLFAIAWLALFFIGKSTK
ncbi:DUF423 domain-containing protein [Thalassotalea fusca]